MSVAIGFAVLLFILSYVYVGICIRKHHVFDSYYHTCFDVGCAFIFSPFTALYILVRDLGCFLKGGH